MSQIVLLVFVTFFSFASFAQKLDSTALILIDIQEFYFPGGAAELVEPEKAALQAGKVLEYFRNNDGLVVHVKHKVRSGGDIFHTVKPIENEKVISKSEVNCFNGTGLNDYLKTNNIKNVVLLGMQTHMCLEGGTRAAYDLGYSCTVVHDACATRDLMFDSTVVAAVDVHASTLSTLKSYSKVVSTQEFLK